MKAREIEAALRAELDEHGAVFLRTEYGKHNRVYFEWRGEEKFCTFSASPSARNAINDALRHLRAIMGVKRRIRKNPDGRKRKRNGAAPATEPVLSAEPTANPFDKLAEHPLSRPERQPRRRFWRAILDAVQQWGAL